MSKRKPGGRPNLVREAALYRPTIKEWPESDRPREKLMRHGPAALTDVELLAILIRTGRRGKTAVDLARRLLTERKTLREVAAMLPSEFHEFEIGPARATAIVAALELVRRMDTGEVNTRPVIKGPEEVVRRFSPRLRDLLQEEFWTLMLNSANRLVGEVRVTTGTLNSSLVHPRECFRPAIREAAASVIFVHNHPSGNAEPSQEDLSITRQLVEAGKVLGIPVHDHVIIAGERYTSFAERGLMG